MDRQGPPHRTARLAPLLPVAVLGLWALWALWACGQPGASSLPSLPKVHRPTVPACPAAPGDVPCTTDADCHEVSPTGSCEAGGTCNLDQCTSDDQCGSLATCSCRGDVKGSQPGAGARQCLAGTCRTDADCGPGGSCSPSVSPGCGPSLGLYGYFCHTAADDCRNDDDCTAGVRPGYCAFHKDLTRWVCGYIYCR